MLKLWVIKAKKLTKDSFKIIHKYKHHYLLQSSNGFRTSATQHQINNNSRRYPMTLY